MQPYFVATARVARIYSTVESSETMTSNGWTFWARKLAKVRSSDSGRSRVTSATLSLMSDSITHGVFCCRLGDDWPIMQYEIFFGPGNQARCHFCLGHSHRDNCLLN